MSLYIIHEYVNLTCISITQQDQDEVLADAEAHSNGTPVPVVPLMPSNPLARGLFLDNLTWVRNLVSIHIHVFLKKKN